jgi:tetratricopeptide (TPR) repeat protein
MDWQVESGLRTAVFVSATTSDLGDYRRRTSDILQGAGIFPVVQDYFGSDFRTIEEMLLDKILSSDAVICLIGHVFGAAPNSDGILSDRSYTQIEFDLANRYEKPIYIFIADDNLAKDKEAIESEELQSKQKEYRRTILTDTRKYQQFASLNELELLIHGLIQPILTNAGRRSFKYLDPPPMPLCFVGRTDETDQLNAAIDKRTPSVIALLGMGGQGKTTLLAHVLRGRTSLPFSGGVWVSAEQGGFSFSEFLDRALQELMGNRFNKTDFPRLDTRLSQLMSILQKRPVLIVIDAIERWLNGWGEDKELIGFQDLSLRQGNCKELDEFLQQASGLNNGSHIILTSRALPAALDLVLCTILPIFPKANTEIGLSGLTPDEAIELLEQQGMVASKEKLTNLAKSLVCHPLALIGFARVAKKLGKDWETLLFEKDNDPSRAFHNLVDEIRKHLPNREISELILKYASLLPEGVSLDLIKWLIKKESNLSQITEEFNLLVLVLALADWNLLIWDSNAQLVRLHSLVAEYFAKLIPDSVRNEIHINTALWYKTRSVEPENFAANYEILALRHYIVANDGKQAFDIMFKNRLENKNLFDRLIIKGNLWECADFLQEITKQVSGLQKVQCILSRVHILNELELSHLALPELQLASAIVLMNSDLNWPPIQILLAKCYGFQGIIQNETGKATIAITFLNKSIKIFDSLDFLSNENIEDLIITLANRGVARKALGDWDGASDDYRRILDLFQRRNLNSETSLDDLMMINEIRFRIANIDMVRGEITGAIEGMELAVGVMRKVQVNSAKRPRRNYLLSLVSLASAYVVGCKPSQALEIVQELIIPIEELSLQGCWEYNGILAQAYINKARAMLKLTKFDDALVASNRSIYLYEDIIKRDAKQLKGQLANALFIRAEAFALTGNEKNMAEDLIRAITISKIWLQDWYGECNIQTVFLENSLRSLSYLSKNFNDIRKDLLIMIKKCIDRINSLSIQNLASKREKEIIKNDLVLLRNIAFDTGIEWEENLL